MIVIAALIIRTALTELRHPGIARRQWVFTTRPGPMAAGATAAAATVMIGGARYGWTAAAWALLIGVLTAFLAGLDTPPAPASRQSKEQPMSGRRIGKVLAAIGTPLTVAGVAMYILPGPGVPVLLTGLTLLFIGLVMTLAAPR
ncbi:hypothetical protein ACGF5T_32320 [Streptomyces sp. NPDC047853]|uniref:hypothetical protein n=1 Tax=unclassified Streptomyces TaxID=2593676 RepID=UPI003452F56F